MTALQSVLSTRAGGTEEMTIEELLSAPITHAGTWVPASYASVPASERGACQARMRMLQTLETGERHAPMDSRAAALAIVERSIPMNPEAQRVKLSLADAERMAALDARDFARTSGTRDAKCALAAIAGNAGQVSGYAEAVLLIAEPGLVAAISAEPLWDQRIAASSVRLRVVHAELNSPDTARTAASRIRLRSLGAHRAAGDLGADLTSRLAKVDLRDFTCVHEAAAAQTAPGEAASSRLEAGDLYQATLAALSRNIAELRGYRDHLRSADVNRSAQVFAQPMGPLGPLGGRADPNRAP